MGQYQRLLLIADPAMRHSEALQRASALAEASGAALHVAAFVEPSPHFGGLERRVCEQARDNQLREQREWLGDEAGLMRSKGIMVTHEVLWSGNACQEILQHVAEMQPDMVIKDVQHVSALKRAFVTPLDWHLLRDCPVPLHLVGTLSHPLPRRVVAAVDTARPVGEDGAVNQCIIQAAHALALQCSAELILLHSFDPSSAFLAEPGVAGKRLVEELREVHHQAFIALAEDYGVPAERRQFVMGSPLTALADAARRLDADVLVMGTVQRTGLNKLIGSTAEHILYQVPCSLLAVRA